MKVFNTDTFIEKANIIHNNKYSYEKAEYVDTKSSVIITCPIHGDFAQTPNAHLGGAGCPLCARKQHSEFLTKSDKYYLEKCKKQRGDFYKYLGIKRKGYEVSVVIECPKHGIFIQGLHNHMIGGNCPKCNIEHKKTLIYGHGINDYEGRVKIGKEHLKSYHLWTAMLERCYDKTQRKTSITYDGCSVCDEWLKFSNFKAWYEKNYKEGYALDKDILYRGNKEYSPNKCVYVPKFINSLLSARARDRGKCVIGVKKSQGGKCFEAQISRYGKVYNLGRYKTEIEAFNVFKREKEKYIKEVSDNYYSRGLIDKRVYDALYRYKINMND